MRDRSLFGAVLLACLILPITSCSDNPDLTSITVNPGAVTTSMTNGLSVDFTAIGYYTHPGHAAITKDITTTATWTTAFPQFVTIGAHTGVAVVTGYGYGVGDIYATAPGFHGAIVGTATFTIQQPSSTAVVTSLVLVPSAKSAGNAVQFTAVGRTSDGATVKLNGQPTWVSTDNQVATIDQNTGVVTKLGLGRTTITAVYRNPDGTTAVGKTYFNIKAEN